MPAGAMNRLRGEAVQTLLIVQISGVRPDFWAAPSRAWVAHQGFGEWNLKVEIYLDCFAAQAVHSYRRDTAEPERSEG